MTVSEEWGPGEEEQEAGGLFGIKFTPTIIGVLAAVAGVAAAVGLYMYVLQPEWTKQEELKGKISAKESEIQQLKVGAAKIEEAKVELQREKQLKAEVEALFGDQTKLDTLLLDINKIVKQGGARIQLFKPDDEIITQTLYPKDKPPLPNLAQFKAVPLRLELAGTFAQTQSIIRNIERLEPLLVMGAFSSKIDEQTMRLVVDEQGKVRGLTEPALDTTLKMTAIVPKSAKEIAGATSATPPAK
ncbi:type 4a pilus biogenesis protein PilO [Microcoleus sp. FACHB-672]|uniref:type 4a pilus biogenesis protein PilO n=1 Tax=Microcoleus sp. FACHB-672 TaxID=2692825 RepID=UPI0016870888|nr:type 4a pilus biogenesis protein PilO [Microcoleus sp. FACHB-672]MBD2041790.1 type 4a pilus biogenesis protein PilO [Microcoleus sp. FACHB-672]